MKPSDFRLLSNSMMPGQSLSTTQLMSISLAKRARSVMGDERERGGQPPHCTTSQSGLLRKHGRRSPQLPGAHEWENRPGVVSTCRHIREALLPLSLRCFCSRCLSGGNACCRRASHRPHESFGCWRCSMHPQESHLGHQPVEELPVGDPDQERASGPPVQRPLNTPLLAGSRRWHWAPSSSHSGSSSSTQNGLPPGSDR